MRDLYRISYESGLACLRTNNFVEALEHFTESIRLHPADPEPLLQRGFAYRMVGDIESAQRDLTASILLNFHNPEAFLQRGFNHISNQKFKLAIKNIGYALMQKPNNPEAYLPLGYAYLKTASYEQAIEYTNRSLNLDPQNPYALGLLNIATVCRDNSLKLNHVVASVPQAVLPARTSEDALLSIESVALASTSLVGQPQQGSRVVSISQAAEPSFEVRTQCVKSTEYEVSQSLY